MIVSDGFYSVYYNYWKTFFGKNLLLVDGTGILKNPALEIIKIQKFLGLDVQVNEDYFVFDEERDFYCLKNRCMKSSKGRSKGRNFPQEIHDKLKKLYKPFDDDIQVILVNPVELKSVEPEFGLGVSADLCLRPGIN